MNDIRERKIRDRIEQSIERQYVDHICAPLNQSNTESSAMAMDAVLTELRHTEGIVVYSMLPFSAANQFCAKNAGCQTWLPCLA